MSDVDHILLIGFGGPPQPEDVAPFLEHVTRGLHIPQARLDVVRGAYAQIGGSSPYNAHTFRLVDRLKERLQTDDVSTPVFVGMRNWHPFLHATLGEIAQRGLRRGLGVVLAPHRSEASFEKYLRNVEDARARAGALNVQYEYVESWHDHPLFLQAQAAQVRLALERMSDGQRATTHLVFSAHAIPVEMARHCRYEEEVRQSSRLVAEALQHQAWSVAYQSRSGDPREPWLEPDVRSTIQRLSTEGVRHVLLVPIGFLCDHTEVLYDLDILARDAVQRAGMTYGRASTVNDHPLFVAMLAQLVQAPRCV